MYKKSITVMAAALLATIITATPSIAAEGVVSEPDTLTPSWVSPGKNTQYPSGGGTWEYGFWDAKARSYFYHATRCHRSSLSVNGDYVRSVDTAPRQTSIAEKWTINSADRQISYYYAFC